MVDTTDFTFAITLQRTKSADLPFITSCCPAYHADGNIDNLFYSFKLHSLTKQTLFTQERLFTQAINYIPLLNAATMKTYLCSFLGVINQDSSAIEN